MNSPLLILFGLLCWAGWAVGRWGYRLAERSPELRTVLLWGGVLAIPLGVYVGLFLPEQLKFNRESPAGIFYVYLPCFLVGGALFAGGTGAFIGALRAKPE